MPITIIPAAHQPKSHPAIQPAESIDQFLHFSCPDSYLPGETHIVASSFLTDVKSDGGTLYPSPSSFVRSAIEAWGRHSHLVLRPDDVWFTILVQVNFFMEKNAESLRDLFVSHQKQKYLEVWGKSWDAVMDDFNAALQSNLKTDWMSEWVSPGFSTTTIDDKRIATVLMMGSMKAFFDYAGGVICGIPSITLLGTKQDWKRLLRKIDRLQDFGMDPKAYANRLRPILSRFVQTFDSPSTTETKDFWNQMVQAKVKHGSCGQPPTQYIVSGWILGFFYWDATGNVSKKFSEGLAKRKEPGALQYDHVRYGEAALEDLPVGYAKCKFKMLNAHGGPTDEPMQGWVLAGNIGKSIADGAPKGYRAALASQYNARKSKAAKDGDECSSPFSGLLRGLNCFGRKQESFSDAMQVQQEKRALKELEEKADAVNTHSTMQPRSGWFLFWPQKDGFPSFYSEEDSEADGPTVDAIDSCGSVVHYRS